jgi:hypothetical protein
VGELFGALANNLAPLPLPMTKEQLEVDTRRGGASSQGKQYEYYERPGMLNVYVATSPPR